MLAKTALLVVSNPSQIGKILVNIHEKVKTTLYIQLLSALSGPLTFQPNVFTSSPMYSSLISNIYYQAAKDCDSLDVRVLLSALKSKSLPKIRTLNTIDLVIFDRKYHDVEISRFVQGGIENIAADCPVLTFTSSEASGPLESAPTNNKVYEHTVLGGTFDRLHAAHKILLSEAVLRSSSKVTVGVTEENMLAGKTLWELTEPLDMRIQGVKDFLSDICSELDINVVPITDPLGPTRDDPTMNLLIVSAETAKGGRYVNEVRKEKSLPLLDVFEVDLINEPNPNPTEEEKISSSTMRMRLLGTLLKPPVGNTLIPDKPYVIGLTGGIASGKSGISQRLKELGAEVIDCDKVAHDVYKPGRPCHKQIVEVFGGTVIAANGEIDRPALGAIVFKSAEELDKLNNIVWPAIAEEVSARIRNSSCKVVVVEAAVLLKAGWEKYCHEVWTSFIPSKVAIERLINRNGLSEEQARSRVDSQLDNAGYIRMANVVFCSLWSKEFTISQVDRAWDLLQARLL
ncbi:hypothetical protein PPYR_13141 [Photinus pyralis]|uniref:Bifunctional coenzyme A synthase n=1 Tax=Photinus pyralis TaxID=7054 RepID=A0A1Y1K7F6_PHOPY|nr:bifunctional coenzyme A synthase isoform X2 [Photinus pyralis]KAB0793521.1 hypothetical protein PPYR_13141 [Photinus pyralis]